MTTFYRETKRGLLGSAILGAYSLIGTTISLAAMFGIWMWPTLKPELPIHRKLACQKAWTARKLAMTASPVQIARSRSSTRTIAHPTSSPGESSVTLAVQEKKGKVLKNVFKNLKFMGHKPFGRGAGAASATSSTTLLNSDSSSIADSSRTRFSDSVVSLAPGPRGLFGKRPLAKLIATPPPPPPIDPTKLATCPWDFQESEVGFRPYIPAPYTPPPPTAPPSSPNPNSPSSHPSTTPIGTTIEFPFPSPAQPITPSECLENARKQLKRTTTGLSIKKDFGKDLKKDFKSFFEKRGARATGQKMGVSSGKAFGKKFEF